MSPREHLDWMVARSRHYLDVGEPIQAVSSLINDAAKCEEIIAAPGMRRRLGDGTSILVDLATKPLGDRINKIRRWITDIETHLSRHLTGGA